jgi:hypothetical protein
MLIDDLTIAQTRELAAMFSKTTTIPAAETSPMVGQHCVVRTFTAGVHIGRVMSLSGTQIILEDARRLWKWSGAFTLSEVATAGIDPKNSRMAVALPVILLTEATEIIPTTEAARKTFEKTHE